MTSLRSGRRLNRRGTCRREWSIPPRTARSPQASSSTSPTRSTPKLQAAIDGDPIVFDAATWVDQDLSEVTGVVRTFRIIPAYMVLRETSWTIANVPTKAGRLEHVGEFVVDQMRLVPGHAALMSLALMMGSRPSRDCARGLLRFDETLTERSDPKLMARVRSASWDLFFSHLVTFLETTGGVGGFRPPFILLTADKRLAQLQDLTSWGGQNQSGFGEHQIHFETLVAAKDVDTAQAWIAVLNEALMSRVSADSLMADRRAMLDFAADYLSRTGDTSWRGLVEAGPGRALADLEGTADSVTPRPPARPHPG